MCNASHLFDCPVCEELRKDMVRYIYDKNDEEGGYLPESDELYEQFENRIFWHEPSDVDGLIDQALERATS